MNEKEKETKKKTLGKIKKLKRYIQPKKKYK